MIPWWAVIIIVEVITNILVASLLLLWGGSEQVETLSNTKSVFFNIIMFLFAPLIFIPIVITLLIWRVKDNRQGFIATYNEKTGQVEITDRKYRRELRKKERLAQKRR